MPYTFGSSDDVLDNQKWFKSGMDTHGSAVLINARYPDGVSLGIFKNNTSVTHGCEHAEDVFIREITTSKVGLLAPSPQGNTVILNISKSPCSSTHGTSNKTVGCAEQLIGFQNTPFRCPITGQEYVFKLIVIARGVYKQSDSSTRALEMMEREGVEVTTDVHRKKDGTPAKKEYA